MNETALSCPSGQPDMPGARLFGIASGTEDNPQIAYLEKTIPITPELLAKTGDVEPQRIFRIAVTCEESRCGQWNGTACTLAQRIVEHLPSDSTTLPPCQIRSSCRWFRQEGKAACGQCSFIATHIYPDLHQQSPTL